MEWNGSWKQKLEMELETEMETKMHQSLVQCFLHGLMSGVLEFYLPMAIGLALWVMLCLNLLLYCAMWLHIQCDWIVFMWKAVLQYSLVHMWEGLIWPWDQFPSWNKANIPTLAASFPDLLPLPVLITSSMRSKWWLHTQALFYKSPCAGSHGDRLMVSAWTGSLCQ